MWILQVVVQVLHGGISVCDAGGSRAGQQAADIAGVCRVSRDFKRSPASVLTPASDLQLLPSFGRVMGDKISLFTSKGCSSIYVAI